MKLLEAYMIILMQMLSYKEDTQFCSKVWQAKLENLRTRYLLRRVSDKLRYGSEFIPIQKRNYVYCIGVNTISLWGRLLLYGYMQDL
jgi:hypothetical protein